MKLTAAVVTALALAATACTGGDSSLEIANDSSYVLTEIYIAPIDTVSWGPDLTGGDVILPGESLIIDSIDCDTYDAMVVDDTGVECILFDLDLCFDDAIWVVDDFTLDSCAF